MTKNERYVNLLIIFTSLSISQTSQSKRTDDQSIRNVNYFKNYIDNQLSDFYDYDNVN